MQTSRSRREKYSSIRVVAKGVSGATGSRDSVGSKFIGSLVSLLVATIIGDLLIKNGVLGYYGDVRKIEIANSEASDKYSSLINDMTEIVETRASSAFLMGDYSGNQNVYGFDTYYDQYYATVRSWSEKFPDVHQRIVDYTSCSPSVVVLPPEVNTDASASAESPTLARNSLSENGNGVGCADDRLFGERRGLNYAASGQDFNSAIEEFKFMHRLITDSKRACRPIGAA